MITGKPIVAFILIQDGRIYPKGDVPAPLADHQTPSKSFNSLKAESWTGKTGMCGSQALC